MQELSLTRNAAMTLAGSITRLCETNCDQDFIIQSFSIKAGDKSGAEDMNGWNEVEVTPFMETKTLKG